MQSAIAIVTYNNPDFLIRQIECIKKFCRDKHEIVVIDNSTDQQAILGLIHHSGEAGCKYIKTNATSHGGSDSHAFACNVGYDKIKSHYDYIFFTDHDSFPIKPFSIPEVLDGHLMAGLGQQKSKTYFWAGCVMFNNKDIDKSLIDFSCNHELELDTGGNLFRVCEAYPCKYFNEVYIQNDQFNGRYNYYSEINNGMFMHFVNGSNWANADKNVERINSLFNILSTKIS